MPPTLSRRRPRGLVRARPSEPTGCTSTQPPSLSGTPSPGSHSRPPPTLQRGRPPLKEKNRDNTVFQSAWKRLTTSLLKSFPHNTAAQCLPLFSAHAMRSCVSTLEPMQRRPSQKTRPPEARILDHHHHEDDGDRQACGACVRTLFPSSPRISSRCPG